MKILELGNNPASYQFFMDQNFSKDIKILEIGCNFGTLTNMLYNSGYKNIIGIDINNKSIEIGKNTYSTIKTIIKDYDGINIPFSIEEFDLVISFDVLEHIPNVNKHLEEVKRILKKGGIYIGQTPNMITNIPWEIINNKSFTQWQTYHCSLQTLHSLKKIFNMNGFEINIQKRNIYNDYNKDKVKNKLGFIGLFLLKIANKLPLNLQTNFWFISKINK